MGDSYLWAEHQPLLVRFLLLFCRERIETRSGRWFYVIKTLRGVDYLVAVYHTASKMSESDFLIFRGRQ